MFDWSVHNKNSAINVLLSYYFGFIISKKRLWHSCFPVNFAKFVRTPFFIEHVLWLLLSHVS